MGYFVGSGVLRFSPKKICIVKKCNMEKIQISLDDLNSIITKAVQTAMDARDRKSEETTLVSREAAAARLGVDVSTLWRWDRSGYFKVSTRIGRACFYTESSLRSLERGEIVAK